MSNGALGDPREGETRSGLPGRLTSDFRRRIRRAEGPLALEPRLVHGGRGRCPGDGTGKAPGARGSIVRDCIRSKLRLGWNNMHRAHVRHGECAVDRIQSGAKGVTRPIHMWQGSGILQKQTGIGSNHGSTGLRSVAER